MLILFSLFPPSAVIFLVYKTELLFTMFYISVNWKGMILYMLNFLVTAVKKQSFHHQHYLCFMKDSNSWSWCIPLFSLLSAIASLLSNTYPTQAAHYTMTKSRQTIVQITAKHKQSNKLRINDTEQKL